MGSFICKVLVAGEAGDHPCILELNPWLPLAAEIDVPLLAGQDDADDLNGDSSVLIS